MTRVCPAATIPNGAGQTLVMLTAGIDLSVAAVMTAAAYVAASQSYFGSIRAVLLALAVGLVVGVLNGLGVAIFRVQPLIMTLGTGLVIAGSLLVYSLNVSHRCAVTKNGYKVGCFEGPLQ